MDQVCNEYSIRVFSRPSSAPNDTQESDISKRSHTIASHKQLHSMPLSQSFRGSTKSTHSKGSKKVQNDYHKTGNFGKWKLMNLANQTK